MPLLVLAPALLSVVRRNIAHSPRKQGLSHIASWRYEVSKIRQSRNPQSFHFNYQVGRSGFFLNHLIKSKTKDIFDAK